MEYMNESYISVKYKKQEFIKLELSPFSDDEEKWNYAINIFEDRIKGRYLDVLDEIVKKNSLLRDGFVVMAINCLLIETLMQFKYGWDKTPSRRNRECYTQFLMEEFPHLFTDITLATKFYTDIRCGILHSAQTKSKSKLTLDPGYTLELFGPNNDEYIKVNVKKMTEVIQEYYRNYIDRLRTNKDDERENFLQKMNCICKK